MNEIIHAVAEQIKSASSGGLAFFTLLLIGVIGTGLYHGANFIVIILRGYPDNNKQQKDED
jgi:hypothetical protein